MDSIPVPSITPDTYAVDPNFRVGYAQNWQLSLQRDLPGSLQLTATYLGIKGTRGVQEFLPNTYPLGAANPCPSCPAGFAYLASNGNSTRQAGQVQLRRRLHNGLTATVQYTFSKSIDDDSALGGQGAVLPTQTFGVPLGRSQGTAERKSPDADELASASSPTIAQNWLDLSAERGLSTFDQRHLLNVQVQYTTGMGLGGETLLSGWKGTLFKEWTFLTQITVGSGLPETPIYLAAVPGTGVTGSIRPDDTGAPLYAAPAGLVSEPRGLHAARGRPMGKRGKRFDHRPVSIHVEHFHGAHLPPARPLQSRLCGSTRRTFSTTPLLRVGTRPSTARSSDCRPRPMPCAACKPRCA